MAPDFHRRHWVWVVCVCHLPAHEMLLSVLGTMSRHSRFQINCCQAVKQVNKSKVVSPYEIPYEEFFGLDFFFESSKKPDTCSRKTIDTCLNGLAYRQLLCGRDFDVDWECPVVVVCWQAECFWRDRKGWSLIGRVFLGGIHWDLTGPQGHLEGWCAAVERAGLATT